MSIYTIATTNSLKSSVPELANAAAGDVIKTSGYYAANDGGAGTFDIRARATGDTVDNMFTYALGTDLIAELQTPDGVVNVDQLGAKGDAIIPTTYDDLVSSKLECNLRTQATIDANNSNSGGFNATDNKSVLHTACTYPKIQEVRLTAGKVYGVRSSFRVQKNHRLNGCGATIMNIHPENNLRMISCYSDTNSSAENVQIENVRLIGNHKYLLNGTSANEAEENAMNVPVGTLDSQGIWIQRGKSIQIRNVQIERFGFGIHTTTPDLAFYNQVNIDGVQMRDVMIGVQLNDAENSSVANSTISSDYTQFEPDNNNKNHCIYAGQKGRNNALNNLVLKNVKGGYAINRHDSSSAHYTNSGWLISNISISNCSKGIHLGTQTQDSIVRHVVGEDISIVGICLSSVENVIIYDCRIIGTASCGGALYISPDSQGENYLRNVLVQNCYFESDKNVIAVGNARTKTGDSMMIDGCTFVVRAANTLQAKVPAFIKGVISQVGFSNCKFEITGFEEADNVIENSRNCVFFYFDGQKGIKMFWSFDHCTFINSTNITLNSPILSNSTYDSSEAVFCSVRNCLVRGFRWLIRIATTNQTQKIINNSTINPCFDNYNVNERELAKYYMSQKSRFLSKRNHYLFDSIVPEMGNSHYVVAEEYGG